MQKCNSVFMINYLFISSKVETPEGKKVGCITKQWTGLAKEVFTKADNFGVTCKRISIQFPFVSGTAQNKNFIRETREN